MTHPFPANSSFPTPEAPDDEDGEWDEDEIALPGDRSLSPKVGEPLVLVVGKDQGGQRLDKWLAATVPDLSRTRVQAFIESGDLKANDGQTGESLACVASAKVKAGQSFCLILPPTSEALPQPQALDLVIVHEDADVIVVDKPAGLVVHPAAGNDEGTLVHGLLHHCAGSLSGIGGVRRPGIVHRLDKDTSGLIIAAKNDSAHQSLAAQFAEHSIERAYLALVWGEPMPHEGEVRGNIGRSPFDRKKMAVVAMGGKHALTRYKVLQTFGDGALSLIECRLATGRTHQIRVHMASIGHPLIGDQTYGKGGANPRIPPRTPARRPLQGLLAPQTTASRVARLPADCLALLKTFPRQALHAKILGFRHPQTGVTMVFSSEIPQDFKALISRLENL